MRFLKHLYVQVLIGLVAGVAVGYAFPDLAVQMKPLGDTFIRLIKMVVTLVIFCTVAIGIARMESLKQVGKVGGKTLLYFELITTLALIIGMVVANVMQPGKGMNVDATKLDDSAMSHYVNVSEHSKGFLEQIIPDSVIGAFAQGNLLQVLLFSVLFGVALSLASNRSAFLTKTIEQCGEVLMRIVELIMQLAPFGAFGAIAFTVGKYGLTSLQHLGMLIVCLYITSFLFIGGVLGLICKLVGVSMWRLIVYFREELLIVLGTSTTESVLPRLMVKMEKLGCDRAIVGLVLPTGYSFNLDGAAIYLTMTSLFIAQATNTDLTLWQQMGLLLILLLTSKGGAGVAGAALIALTATLATHNIIPLAGITLVLGIDRILNEMRAVTNMIGNVVATLVIARWENKLDLALAQEQLRAGPGKIVLPDTPLPDTEEEGSTTR